jgi:hypothetical protein
VELCNYFPLRKTLVFCRLASLSIFRREYFAWQKMLSECLFGQVCLA